MNTQSEGGRIAVASGAGKSIKAVGDARNIPPECPQHGGSSSVQSLPPLSSVRA